MKKDTFEIITNLLDSNIEQIKNEGFLTRLAHDYNVPEYQVIDLARQIVITKRMNLED